MKLNKLGAILTGILNRGESDKTPNSANYTGVSNKIESDDVSPKAIKGDHITILKGSLVCENSSVGSYNYIGYNTLISKTEIGRYNSIASNINIGHGEHPLDLVSTSLLINPVSYEELTRLDCIITHDVWIGSGATIRRGVTLGIGCVVGANAFVNKDVPPFAVVGGVPAVILKYRFPQEKIDKILVSKWWEHDLEKAQLIVKELENED
jgi:virginiamycin A acetyltransferase